MFITSWIKKIAGLFASGKAQRAFAEVERILPLVTPIVEGITKLTPTRRDDEVIAAFNEHGIPWLSSFSANPTNALRYLAQAVVRRSVPAAAQSVVNAAIELAVLGTKR